MDAKLYDLLMKIKPCPTLYIGRLSLEKLRALIGGFFLCQGYYDSEGSSDFNFQRFVQNKYGIKETAYGWDDLITQNTKSDTEAFKVFYEFLEEFKKLSCKRDDVINISEYLKCVLENQEYIEWINDDDFYEKLTDDIMFIDEELLLNLICILDKSNLKNKFWETILPFISEESITKNVFEYFIKNNLGIVALAHKNFDDDKLKILSKYAEEALYTLANRIYISENYSPYDFALFLNDNNNDLMLEILLLKKTTNTSKENTLHYFLYKKEKSPEKIKKIIDAKFLRYTHDIKQIETAYKLNEYLFNLAISCNIFCPEYILSELLNISGMKFGSKIRNNANETLRIKKILDKGFI